MKTLYLCGGINGLNDDQCIGWRETVKVCLGTTYTYRDPVRRDYRGREDECVREIVEGDIVDIWDSDIVLANATRPSWGTAMEIRLAHAEAGIPVISVVGDGSVSPWLRHHSDAVVGTVEEAVMLLTRMATEGWEHPKDKVARVWNEITSITGR